MKERKISHVGLISSESVKDARGKDDEVVLFQLDAHPLVALVAHVKVALAAADVANLLVLVQVLVEEHLDLVLVHVAHLLRRHDNLVAVLVAAVGSQDINLAGRGQVVVQHAQAGQRICRHLTAGIVRQTLVALCDSDARVSTEPHSDEAGWLGGLPAGCRTCRPSS